MWSDHETHKDFLGYQVHSELLQRIILNDSLLPISIGVFGNWGSGKSSLILLLEDGINKWVTDTEMFNKSKTDAVKVFISNSTPNIQIINVF